LLQETVILIEAVQWAVTFRKLDRVQLLVWRDISNFLEQRSALAAP